MNSLIGNITSIQTNNELSLVKIAVGKTIITSIVIDTTATSNYLKIGNSITIFFKETEVSISTDLTLKISIQNQIICKITAINHGLLLSEISLFFDSYTIKSIITTNACEQLNLIENIEVLALIKTNEIILSSND